MKFLTIDLGNSIFNVNTGFEFNSRIKGININELDFNEGIIYKDKVYVIGQGEYEHLNTKTHKEYLEEFLLYAIGCSTNEDAVKIILNLPVNQLANKNILKERLEGKEFNFTINSPSHNIIMKERKIKICKIGVVAESVASYFSLDKELSDFITVLDIGSKTINYSTYTQISVNDLDKSGTMDFGIHDFYQSIIDYHKKHHFKTYSIQDIDNRIRANRIEVPEHLKKSFIDKIKNEFNAKGFLDYNDYSIKCVGGGSIVLGNELINTFNDCIVLDNPLFRNVIGSELIGKSMGF